MPPSLWDNLSAHNLSITPDFLEKSEVSSLRNELEARRATGKFRAAGVGKAAKNPTPSIRGDFIDWWDNGALTPPQKVFYDRLMGIAESVNRLGYLGIVDLEAHYAVYPPGAHYERHVDRFQSDDRRVLSFICYLNEIWESQWGGELVCYSSENIPTKILPHGGKLVVFFSELIAHEVLTPTRNRYSITGWFRRRPV